MSVYKSATSQSFIFFHVNNLNLCLSGFYADLSMGLGPPILFLALEEGYDSVWALCLWTHVMYLYDPGSIVNFNF